MKAKYIVPLTILSHFYLIGCFVETTFNVTEWHVVTRILVSVIGTGIAGIAATVQYAEDA